VNAQEHYVLAESHYARSRHHVNRQAYDTANCELLVANYHAMMVLATAKIVELETGQ
jgi:hypothetical protein